MWFFDIIVHDSKKMQNFLLQNAIFVVACHDQGAG